MLCLLAGLLYLPSFCLIHDSFNLAFLQSSTVDCGTGQAISFSAGREENFDPQKNNNKNNKITKNKNKIFFLQKIRGVFFGPENSKFDF